MNLAFNLLVCQRCLECVNDHLGTKPDRDEDGDSSSGEDEEYTEYGSEMGSNAYESLVRTPNALAQVKVLTAIGSI